MKTKIGLLLLSVVLFLACQSPQSSENLAVKNGMIKVTILYPYAKGNTFNMDYYANNHMAMVESLLGDSLKMISIDLGIASGTPDEPAPYMAIGYLYFEKLSAFQNSFGPHAETIRNDISNYTNVEPIIQISQVYQ